MVYFEFFPINLYFSLFLTAYYRGAMGILLVYDVTDESSFNSNPLILNILNPLGAMHVKGFCPTFLFLNSFCSIFVCYLRCLCFIGVYPSDLAVLCRSKYCTYKIASYHFSDIRNWIRNIEQHASDNVNKVLVGNKADMDESKRVSYLVGNQDP